MSSFATSNHITAWAGLAPKDNKSADKLKSSKTQKANIYIKSVLTECAWAAVRTRNTRLSNWYWSNVKRLGEKKAITAVARKILVYIYAMLKSGETYDDSLDVADTQKRKAEKLDSAHKTIAHQTYSASQRHQQNIEQNASEPIVAQPDTNDILPVDEAMATANKTAPQKKRGRPRKTECINKQEEIHLP